MEYARIFDVHSTIPNLKIMNFERNARGFQGMFVNSKKYCEFKNNEFQKKNH